MVKMCRNEAETCRPGGKDGRGTRCAVPWVLLLAVYVTAGVWLQAGGTSAAAAPRKPAPDELIPILNLLLLAPDKPAAHLDVWSGPYTGATLCARAGGVVSADNRCEELWGYWQGKLYKKIRADYNSAVIKDINITVPKEEVKLCSAEANSTWGWGSLYQATNRPDVWPGPFTGDTVCVRAGGYESGDDRCEGLWGYWQGKLYKKIRADWNFAVIRDIGVTVPKQDVRLCSDEANKAWGWGANYQGTTPNPTNGTRRTLRVLCMGDSNTKGVGNLPGVNVDDGHLIGYRLYLKNYLAAAGQPIDLVGSKKAGYAFTTDCEHEGYPGRGLDYMQNLINWGMIQAQTPDVILFLCGPNDMWVSLDNRVPITDAAATARVEQLRLIVADLRQRLPNAQLVIAKPATPRSAQRPLNIYRSGIDTLQGVSIIDAQGCANDSVHYTPQGFEALAARWGQAILQYPRRQTTP